MQHDIVEELDQLHLEVNELRSQQWVSRTDQEKYNSVAEGARKKYKTKIHRLKVTVKDLKGHLHTQREAFSHEKDSLIGEIQVL